MNRVKVLVLMLLAPPVSAQEWTPVDLGTTATLRAIGQGSSAVRYLVGDSGYVAQSGVTFADWTPVDIGSSVDLKAVIEPAPGRVWVSGSGGVVRVRDDTEAWNVRDIPDQTQSYVLFARDTGSVLAAGSGGSVWETTDEGISWTLRESGTTTALHAGVSTTGGDYVVGDGGLIRRSTDSGATWTPLPSGTSENLYAIEQAGSAGFRIAVVGANGTILTSDDDGATWIPRASGTTATLRALVRRREGFGSHLAFGDGGTVIRSFSSAASWCSLATGVTTDFYTGLMQTDVTIYLAAGEGGVLLRTETGGGSCAVVANDPEVPLTDFALSQVWPNPAYTEATLTLRVDRPQHVTAEVFDLLGRRVAGVFAGDVAAGFAVPIAIDVQALAPGTYFVRVRGIAFVESRRMVVVR